MPLTEADYLPSMAELTVPEINLSSAPLRAGAHHLGKYCDNQSKEFMLCQAEEKDPRKCLMEGKELTRCGLQFFRKLKNSCADEFTDYWKCIDHSSYDMNFKNCRKTQQSFDKCVLENLGQERPDLGYFSKARIHSTSRPQPKRPINLPEPTPEYDMSKKGEETPPEYNKLGNRSVFT